MTKDYLHFVRCYEGQHPPHQAVWERVLKPLSNRELIRALDDRQSARLTFQHRAEILRRMA